MWHTTENQMLLSNRIYVATPDSRSAPSVYRKELSDDLISKVNYASERTSESDLDLPSAIARTVSDLDGGTVVVVSNGLSTAGSLDLRSIAPDIDGRGLAERLQVFGVLRDLGGWNVVFTDVGGGDVSSRLPGWSPNNLAMFWRTLLTAAGAEAQVSAVNVKNSNDYLNFQDRGYRNSPLSSQELSKSHVISPGCCDVAPLNMRSNDIGSGADLNRQWYDTYVIRQPRQ